MSREGKGLSPGVSTGRKRRILATLEEKKALWRQLKENDDATLERHCELWEEGAGTRVSVSTMSRAIRHKLGWTFIGWTQKKTLGATERDEEARGAWRERVRGVAP
jgi:transposase